MTVTGTGTEDPGTDPGGLRIPEEPPKPASTADPAAPPTPPAGFISEDEVERRLSAARQEEKAKLYPELEDYKRRVKAQEDAERARNEAEERQQREQEEAKRRADEAEMSAKEIAERRAAELQAQIDQIAADRERERLIFERERELDRVDAYRERRIREELQAETIIARLATHIRGNTEDEIEESIRQIQADSQAIFEEAEAAFTARSGGAPPEPRRQPPPLTGAPPSGGPGDQEPTFREYSLAELQAMPMDEYRKHREQFLAATREAYYGGRGN